jgi:hypothetical protein
LLGQKYASFESETPSMFLLFTRIPSGEARLASCQTSGLFCGKPPNALKRGSEQE